MPTSTPGDELAPLMERLERRDAAVGVVGLGAVGLPLAALAARAGHRLVLVDHDPVRVGLLREGRAPLAFLPPEVGEALATAPAPVITTDPAALAGCDVVVLCLPTPLGPGREPDLGPIEAGLDAAAPHIRPGALVVLESTTWPGTTREIVAARLPGRLVAYSPERVDPGRSVSVRGAPDPLGRSVPKLVAGLDEASSAAARAFYGGLFDSLIPVSRPEVAEAAKLVENVYRAVNIALVNELKVAFQAMDLDVWEVLDAAETKPFGFTRFEPGPGMGGHCIPIDPFYLAWAARRAGAEARFVELAGEINRAAPRHVVDRCARALEERGGSLSGARVLLLGLAFKPDVDITEESPALALHGLLVAAGAEVAYSDPHVPVGPRTREHDLGDLRSVPLDAGTLAAFDLALIATHHSDFDWELIARHARLVVDTRNALGARLAGDPRYVRA